MQLYPLLYEVLQRENFHELVKKHFPNWTADEEKLDQALIFIKSCVMFNLEDRPSSDDLLKLKLFGGHVEKYCPKESPDIWIKKMSSINLMTLASRMRIDHMSDSDNDIYDNKNNDNKEKQIDESKVEERDIKKEFLLGRDQVDKDPRNLTKTSIDVKNKTENIKIKDNVNGDVNKSNRDKYIKEKKIEVNKKNNDTNEEEKLNDLLMRVRKMKLRAFNETKVLKFDRDVKKDTAVFEKKKNKVNVDEISNTMRKMFEESEMRCKMIGIKNESNANKKQANDIKKQAVKIGIKENVNNDMNKSNGDKDVKKAKTKIDEKNIDLNVSKTRNDMKKETKNVKGVKTKTDEKNKVSNVNEKTNDIRKKAKDMKEEKIESDEKNKDSNVNEKRNDMIKETKDVKGIKSKTNEKNKDSNVNEKRNETKKETKDVQKVNTKSDEKNKDSNLNEKRNDIGNVTEKLNLTNKIAGQNNILKNDKDMKNDKIEFDKNYDNLNVKGEVNAIKNVNGEKENEAKENVIDKLTGSNTDKGIKKDKIGFMKENKNVSKKEKTNDIKKECNKIKIKESITDSMKISSIDKDVKKEKIETALVSKDLNMKENTNAVKQKLKEVEIKELEIDYMNIAKSDRGEKKNETDKNNKDLKEKTNDSKKEAEKREMKENVFYNNTSNNDRDAKENKGELDEKNEDLSTKVERNNVILDKNVTNLNEIDQDITDTGLKNDELKEPFQLEQSIDPVLNSNTHSREILPASFETNKNAKKMKRHRKKDIHVKENKNEDRNTKNENNDAVLEINVGNFKDIEHDQINTGHSKVEHIEALQFELHNAPIFKSSSDSPKSLSDSFEISKQNKKMKQRRKKDKPENFPIKVVGIKLDRINYEKGLISDDISGKYNDERAFKRPRKRLSKAHQNDKSLEIQEHHKRNQRFSLITCEKRDDTNQKRRSEVKTYDYLNIFEGVIENAENSLATSSSENERSAIKAYSSKKVVENFKRSSNSSNSSNSSKEKQKTIRKSYLPKNVAEKVELSSVFSSSEKLQDCDLEPGEVNLFKKDYGIVPDKIRPKNPVSSYRGVANNVDESDLEEGEVDPNNPGSCYDLKPRRTGRRFKDLRSWWKRQKKNLTSCFTACFSAGD